MEYRIIYFFLIHRLPVPGKVAYLKILGYKTPNSVFLYRQILIESLMVKLTQVGEHQYVITIPQELRKAMGWEKGTELEFTVKDAKTLEITKKD